MSEDLKRFIEKLADRGNAEDQVYCPQAILGDGYAKECLYNENGERDCRACWEKCFTEFAKVGE